MADLKQLLSAAEEALGLIVLSTIRHSAIQATGQMLYDGTTNHYGAVINHSGSHGLLMLHVNGTYLPLLGMQFPNDIETVNAVPIEAAHLIAHHLSRAARSNTQGLQELDLNWAALSTSEESQRLHSQGIHLLGHASGLDVRLNGRTVAHFSGARLSPAGHPFAIS